MNNIYDMTVRDLRELLFECLDQDITIRELRNKLFHYRNQEEKAYIFLSSYS